MCGDFLFVYSIWRKILTGVLVTTRCFAKREEMKTFLLITTVMMSTPDKDFSGVIVEEFPSKIQCTMKLDNQPNTMIDFGLMKVEVKRKCEEKK